MPAIEIAYKKEIENNAQQNQWIKQIQTHLITGHLYENGLNTFTIAKNEMKYAL